MAATLNHIVFGACVLRRLLRADGPSWRPGPHGATVNVRHHREKALLEASEKVTTGVIIGSTIGALINPRAQMATSLVAIGLGMLLMALIAYRLGSLRANEDATEEGKA